MKAGLRLIPLRPRNTREPQWQSYHLQTTMGVSRQTGSLLDIEPLPERTLDTHDRTRGSFEYSWRCLHISSHGWVAAGTAHPRSRVTATWSSRRKSLRLGQSARVRPEHNGLEAGGVEVVRRRRLLIHVALPPGVWTSPTHASTRSPSSAAVWLSPAHWLPMWLPGPLSADVARAGGRRVTLFDGAS